jgi:hypothetical protein
MDTEAMIEDVWTNPSGTLKGVGPGTELDWYVQRLRANQSNVVKVDLCKQMLGPEGTPVLLIIHYYFILAVLIYYFVLFQLMWKGEADAHGRACRCEGDHGGAGEQHHRAQRTTGRRRNRTRGSPRRYRLARPLTFRRHHHRLTAPPHHRTCATDRPRPGAVGQALLKNRSLKTVFLVCAPGPGPSVPQLQR